MAKRKSMSLLEKLEVIETLEQGTRQRDICKTLGLSKSTVSAMWKAKENIKRLVKQGDIDVNIKRQREFTNKGVDSALFRWVRQQQSAAAVSQSQLKAKAEEFAEKLGIKRYMCSSGWLDRFKRRHNIVFRKTSAKARIPLLVDAEFANVDVKIENETEPLFSDDGIKIEENEIKIEEEEMLLPEICIEELEANTAKRVDEPDMEKTKLPTKEEALGCLRKLKIYYESQNPNVLQLQCLEKLEKDLDSR